MLIKSFVNVYFKGEIGDEWKNGNGARQGGNFPDTLSFFFDDFNECSLEIETDCKLDAKCYNIIANAYHIALLAPSKTGLHFLIDNTGVHFLFFFSSQRKVR